MNPETVQYLVYAGLVVAGWILRHYNIGGLVKEPAASQPSVSQTDKVVQPITQHFQPSVITPEASAKVADALGELLISHLKNAKPTT